MLLKLDFLFPFLLMSYGFLLIFVFEFIPLTVRSRLSVRNLDEKQILAWICLWGGALWALQNLWLA